MGWTKTIYGVIARLPLLIQRRMLQTTVFCRSKSLSLLKLQRVVDIVYMGTIRGQITVSLPTISGPAAAAVIASECWPSRYMHVLYSYP